MSMKSVPLYWLQYEDICSEQSYTQFLMSTEKSNNKDTKSVSLLLIDGSHQSDAVIIIIY